MTLDGPREERVCRAAAAAIVLVKSRGKSRIQNNYEIFYSNFSIRPQNIVDPCCFFAPHAEGVNSSLRKYSETDFLSFQQTQGGCLEVVRFVTGTLSTIFLDKINK